MVDINARKIIEMNNDSINSYVIVYKTPDSKEEKYYSVKFSDNILEKLYMFKSLEINVLAVYNYALDLNAQFEEERPRNITPFPQTNTTEEEVQKALDYASLVHKEQFRKTGDPYIVHPIRVAENVKKYCNNEHVNFLRQCALLHDVVEDGQKENIAMLIELTSKFGIKVASIVHELTNDPKKKAEVGKEKYLEQKMEVMSSLALFVKLCDRLDNVKDLNGTSEEFVRKIVGQTINILNYTIDNRMLHKDHIEVMSDIITALSDYDINDRQKIIIDRMGQKLERKKETDRLMLIKQL